MPAAAQSTSTAVSGLRGPFTSTSAPTPRAAHVPVPTGFQRTRRSRSCSPHGPHGPLAPRLDCTADIFDLRGRSRYPDVSCLGVAADEQLHIHPRARRVARRLGAGSSGVGRARRLRAHSLPPAESRAERTRVRVHPHCHPTMVLLRCGWHRPSCERGWLGSVWGQPSHRHVAPTNGPACPAPAPVLGRSDVQAYRSSGMCRSSGLWHRVDSRSH